jgi:hypothetical protein
MKERPLNRLAQFLDDRSLSTDIGVLDGWRVDEDAAHG